MEIDSNVLGEIIKDRRKELNMSQEELANKSGLSQGYISELEKGEKENPSKATLTKLADTLGIMKEEFYAALMSEDDRAAYVKEQNAMYAVTNDNKDFVRKYNNLKDKHKKLIDELMDAINKED